jgi:hypothetical protein
MRRREQGMERERVDHVGITYRAARVCLGGLRAYREVLRVILLDTWDSEAGRTVPAPEGLLRKHDQAAKDLAAAVETLVDALPMVQARAGLCHENTVGLENMEATSWVELVEGLAVRDSDLGWHSRTTRFDDPSVRKVISGIVDREIAVRFEVNSGFLEAKLRREEMVVRGGPAPVKGKFTNGLFRRADNGVTFAPATEGISDQSLRILEQLILAEGEWVPVERIVDKAWGHNEKPSCEAIRTAMSAARKVGRRFGLRIPRGKDSNYRVFVEAPPSS